MSLFVSWLYQGATITTHIQLFLSSRICILSVYFLVQPFRQKFPRLIGLVGEWRRFVYHDIFYSCFGYLFVKDILFSYKSQELFSAFNGIPNVFGMIWFFGAHFLWRESVLSLDAKGRASRIPWLPMAGLTFSVEQLGGGGEGKVGGAGVEAGELELASKK